MHCQCKIILNIKLLIQYTSVNSNTQGTRHVVQTGKYSKYRKLRKNQEFQWCGNRETIIKISRNISDSNWTIYCNNICRTFSLKSSFIIWDQINQNTFLDQIRSIAQNSQQNLFSGYFKSYFFTDILLKWETAKRVWEISNEYSLSRNTNLRKTVQAYHFSLNSINVQCIFSLVYTVYCTRTTCCFVFLLLDLQHFLPQFHCRYC